MYKSPIEIFHKDYMQQYIEQMVSSIYMAIAKKLGADIDRDELIKALNYDRRQYEKGFADGVASAQPQWIPVTERLPEINTAVMVADAREDYVSEWEYTGNGLWHDKGFSTWPTEDITHWMPLPQPPKGDE